MQLQQTLKQVNYMIAFQSKHRGSPDPTQEELDSCMLSQVKLEYHSSNFKLMMC